MTIRIVHCREPNMNTNTNAKMNMNMNMTMNMKLKIKTKMKMDLDMKKNHKMQKEFSCRQDRTAGTKLLGQDSRAKISRTEQHRTAGTEQQG